ncbi:RagB/SusD family nutrient uptake outer membrane protein [Pedobacter paludis]|nr:RagB/SusD family nutrient uptake outer membrane protein [Pedobacter paludis]
MISAKKTTITKDSFCSLFMSCAMALFILFSGCKKLVEVPSPSSTVDIENVYNDDVTAAAVLNGMYTELSLRPGLEVTSSAFLSVAPGLSADELTLFANNDSYIDYYRNSLNANSVNNVLYWSAGYHRCYASTVAIEGLTKADKLTPDLRRQLLGQAYFLRAFQFFYLTSLYGDVPLPLTSNYKVNELLPRAPSEEVMNQVIADLRTAETLVSENYIDVKGKKETSTRITPNKAAVQAMLARAYLFKSDYQNAEKCATAVINQTSRYKLVPLDEVFLANSSEAIWQLQPVINGANTQDGLIFILPSSGPGDSYPFLLDNQLAVSFSVNDLRKKKWVGTWTDGTQTVNYPFKYKIGNLGEPVTEFKMVLRLAEVYLIRAEALARLGRIEESKTDLNAIRSRAGVASVTATNQQAVIDDIINERRLELFTEWGDRWFTLKRTGIIDQVMPGVSVRKASSWNSNWQRYPIPKRDRDLNPNLSQNAGY